MACVVPQCKSGHGNKSLVPPGVRMHRFPKPQEQFEAWVKAIPRSDWHPKKHSRVCSLHFEESDYETEHRDSNTRRAYQSEKLTIQRLKPTAIPRKFPGCPSYLSTKKPQQRAESCRSEERRRRLIQKAESEAEAFLQQDKINSQDELCISKFDFPPSWNITSIKISSRLIFEGVNFHQDGKPFFKFTLTVNELLSFSLTSNEVSVPTGLVKHIVPNNFIERHSDVFNILAFIRSYSESDAKSEDIIQDCIQKMSSSKDLQNNSHQDAPKIKFLIQQLQLAMLPAQSRRFSPDFLWTCIRWMKTSSTLYDALIKENLLCLPSSSHLKRLSSAYCLETGLSESTTAYLSERVKSLTEEEKTVAILIDEVFSLINSVVYFIFLPLHVPPADTALVLQKANEAVL